MTDARSIDSREGRQAKYASVDTSASVQVAIDKVPAEFSQIA